MYYLRTTSNLQTLTTYYFFEVLSFFRVEDNAFHELGVFPQRLPAKSIPLVLYLRDPDVQNPDVRLQAPGSLHFTPTDAEREREMRGKSQTSRLRVVFIAADTVVSGSVRLSFSLFDPPLNQARE